VVSGIHDEIRERWRRDCRTCSLTYDENAQLLARATIRPSSQQPMFESAYVVPGSNDRRR